MPATPTPGSRCDVFRDALMDAVIDGQSPARTCDLGPETRSIIEAIADWHPEADPTLIADAYDAFDREASDG
jgi:hypothetical protein